MCLSRVVIGDDEQTATVSCLLKHMEFDTKAGWTYRPR